MLPLEDFLNFVEKEQLFKSSERILLAVSGGKDSVFMAHLFAQVAFKFGIAHCNFQLRGKEADADERFVKKLAETLKVDFFSTKFHTADYARQHKISTQMAARELRYEWFEHIRATNQYDKIAIAQHQTDVVETMLLNLIRGTGISGLRGILPKRDRIVRPLLFLTADDIREKVALNAIAYREDISNASTKYKRNALRHQVLPVLRALNPRLEATFVDNAKHFYSSEQFARAYINDLRDTLFTQNEGNIEIALEALKNLWEPPFLFELFKDFNFTEAVLSDLITSADNGSGKSFYSRTHQITLDRQKLLISENKEKESRAIQVASIPGTFTFYGRNYRLSYSKDTQIENDPLKLQMDAHRVALPLSVRSWQVGDRFKPLGMKGTKKVSDYLIDNKIPLIRKDKIPILMDAHQNIVSIGTLQLGEPYKITTNTEKVLIFEQL